MLNEGLVWFPELVDKNKMLHCACNKLSILSLFVWDIVGWVTLLFLFFCLLKSSMLCCTCISMYIHVWHVQIMYTVYMDACTRKTTVWI